MSKKYKELPAFETNEFKAGDVINVYVDYNTIHKVTVNNSFGDYLDFGAELYGRYHFKQCRKLEEVKPREFWIYSAYDHNPDEHPDPRGVRYPKAFKVREVLDEEK